VCDTRPVRLAYQPSRTVFFFHNKSINSTFGHGLSAKRTGRLYELCGQVTRHHRMIYWPINISPDHIVVLGEFCGKIVEHYRMIHWALVLFQHTIFLVF
jgi:hypothetical protein